MRSSSDRKKLSVKVRQGSRPAANAGVTGEDVVTTFLLIMHGLMAVALLGGLTHQAFAVLWPARATGGFTSAYRAVSAARFTNANITFYTPTH